MILSAPPKQRLVISIRHCRQLPMVWAETRYRPSDIIYPSIHPSICPFMYPSIYIYPSALQHHPSGTRILSATSSVVSTPPPVSNPTPVTNPTTVSNPRIPALHPSATCARHTSAHQNQLPAQASLGPVRIIQAPQLQYLTPSPQTLAMTLDSKPEPDIPNPKSSDSCFPEGKSHKLVSQACTRIWMFGFRRLLRFCVVDRFMCFSDIS